MRKINIIILLVFCLTLLLLTGCRVNTVIAKKAIENLENQEDINQSSNNFQSAMTGSVQEPTEELVTKNPQKWSGLGMGIFSGGASDIDIILANGFEELRIDIPDYQDAIWLNDSKATVIGVTAKGAKVIWGVSSNSFNNTKYTITAENWVTFRQAILDAAQWAQDNGVYEFQLGNEEENHVDGETMTVAQIITNLKSVATEVQAMFTRGNVSYTCSANNITDWISGGKGDIDILASNIYREYGAHYAQPWETQIDALVGAFGTDGTYLTEFNLSWSSLDDYSTDEAVQAAALTEMIEYIKASGITRAFYFCYQSDNFGALKNDGTYRLLWSQALLNSGSVESTTVSTKTTTISLPDTIALIPK